MMDFRSFSCWEMGSGLNEAENWEVFGRISVWCAWMMYKVSLMNAKKLPISHLRYVLFSMGIFWKTVKTLYKNV